MRKYDPGYWITPYLLCRDRPAAARRCSYFISVQMILIVVCCFIYLQTILIAVCCFTFAVQGFGLKPASTTPCPVPSKPACVKGEYLTTTFDNMCPVFTCTSCPPVVKPTCQGADILKQRTNRPCPDFQCVHPQVNSLMALLGWPYFMQKWNRRNMK